MANRSTEVCNVFKEQLALGNHHIGTDTFKIALFGDNVDLTHETTDFPVGHDIVATGYAAGGAEIDLSIQLTDRTVRILAGNVTYPQLIKNNIYGALIYNSSLASNNAVFTYDIEGHLRHPMSVNGPITYNWNNVPILVMS